MIDPHPATVSWLASVRRQRVIPLGVDRFGQSGDLPDLYREYHLNVAAIVDRGGPRRHVGRCLILCWPILLLYSCPATVGPIRDGTIVEIA